MPGRVAFAIQRGARFLRPGQNTRSFSVSRGQALILVLLLSFGLWAVIWGAIALLAICGRQ